jgi:hypothetical protein
MPVCQQLISVENARQKTEMKENQKNGADLGDEIQCLEVIICRAIPWSNRSHKFSVEVRHYHPREYFLVSGLYDILAAGKKEDDDSA